MSPRIPIGTQIRSAHSLSAVASYHPMIVVPFAASTIIMQSQC
jgi:hypothetical protein